MMISLMVHARQYAPYHSNQLATIINGPNCLLLSYVEYLDLLPSESSMVGLTIQVVPVPVSNLSMITMIAVPPMMVPMVVPMMMLMIIPLNEGV